MQSSQLVVLLFLSSLASLLFISLFQGTAYATGSSNLSATVSVVCPFKIAFNVSPAYAKTGNILMNYTMFTTEPCNISNMSGKFTITNAATGSVVYSEALFAQNTTELRRTYNLSVSTAGMSNTSYIANVTFSTFKENVSTIAKFTLYNPPAINITGISVSPHSILYGSPLGVYISLTNKGQFSSGPIMLHVSLSGSIVTSGNYLEQPLGPGQNETVFLSIPNTPASIGTGTASVYATYRANNVNYTSNTASATYAVLAIQPKPIPKPTVPITVMPQFSIASFPLSVSLPIGGSSVGTIGISDVATAPEYVSLSIGAYSSMAALSTNTLYLLPGKTAYASVLYKVNSTALPGTYVIPISISAAVANASTASATEYSTLNVYAVNRTKAMMENQLDLYNSTGSVSGTVEVFSPSNASANNIIVKVSLPAGIVSSIDQLHLYGAPGNVTVENGIYTLNWYISKLQANSSTNVYYSISNPLSIVPLQEIQSELSTVSVPTPSSILRIVSTYVPTLYTNSTANMTIYALYTGAYPGIVYVSATPPIGIRVYNSTQAIDASPNQLLHIIFPLAAGSSPGTSLVQLYMQAQGYNYTYQFPLVVMPKPAISTTSTTTIPQKVVKPAVNMLFVYVFVGFIILAFALLTGYRRHAAGPRYSRYRADKLKMMREQIKRSEEEHGD